MQLQVFVDKVGPVVSAAWLNFLDTIRFYNYDISSEETQAGLTEADINTYRNYWDMRRYKLPVDGTSDCTPALNKAIAVANTFGLGMRFVWPRGTYRYASRPTDIVAPIYIEGQGQNVTYHVRDYTTTAGVGIFNLRHLPGVSDASGCTFLDMHFSTASGRSGGTYISGIAGADGGGGGDWTNIDRVTFSNTGGGGGDPGPDYMFYFDGILRTSPAGVRNINISNSIVFGGALGAAYLATANGFLSTNTSYASAGSVSGKVVIKGVSGNPISNFSFMGGSLYGIDLDYATLGYINVIEMNGNVTNTVNVSNIQARYKQTSGTTQDNWTGSVYQSPEGFPNNGVIVGKDLLVGSPTSIGATPRIYAKAGAANGCAVYGEQTVPSGYVYNSLALSNGGTYFHHQFLDAGVSHGSISSNGTTTTYATSSDARLKKAISAAAPNGRLFDSIKIRSFTWVVNDKEERYGAIAQELITVFPECVVKMGPEDEAMLGVDYNKLVPLLILEVQDLRRRLTQVETP